MNILVLIKEVPVVNDIRIDEETLKIDRESAGKMMNPADRYALEAAISAAEQLGGNVTAFSMGPESCESVLREAIGMGASEAVRITLRVSSACGRLSAHDRHRSGIALE